MRDYKSEILNHDTLFLLMYAQRNEKNYPNVEDVIISASVKDDIDFTADGQGFAYIYGMFTGDYDYHDFDDYGKTWAFTKKELIEFWNFGGAV